jgi:hypothetical protein
MAKVGILINKNYKYENVELVESGAKVTANQVTIQENSVVRVDSGNVSINGRTFNFSIANYGINGEKTYNLTSVPEGVDGQAIIKEFVEFVENDIIS